jgi:uronate dehydrogenase
MRHPCRILVTGAAGAVGQAIIPALRRRGHWVRGLDRQPPPAVDEAVTGDITDHATVHQAGQNVDTLLHLAAFVDDGDFLRDLLEPNIRGLYYVMDTARRRDVRRVILASTVHTVSPLHGVERRITPQDQVPRGHYGLTKIWAERTGELYARRFGLSVVAARLGWLPREPETVRKIAGEGEAQYISHDDAVRFFIAAVEAEEIDFAVLYAVGPGARNGYQLYDMTPGRDLIGYQPRDYYPDGLHFESR